jgi:hypothetical protein
MEEHADHGYTETKHTLRGRLVQPANMLGLIAAQLHSEAASQRRGGNTCYARPPLTANSGGHQTYQ